VAPAPLQLKLKFRNFFRAIAVAIALLSAYVAPAQSIPHLTGSFVTFDRNFTAQMWTQELATQSSLGHKILILPGCGDLMPSASDPTGYTVNPQTLIYPSKLFPANPPVLDNLGMLLNAADEYGMTVYIGSLQTYGDWGTGAEFSALHKYDPLVAEEIMSLYGSHPSLGKGNWYFSHEIWLNWVKYYGSGYYGIAQLATYVSEMKAINSGAKIVEAAVFKEQSNGSMPGLSASETGTWLATLVAGSDVSIVAPQDGAGAQAGAPTVPELGAYYAAMQNSLSGAIASGSVQLWTTAETFQAVVPGTESANGWQPAPLSRIQQQLTEEAPYVSQIIEYIYEWDMSPEATYTPVEAKTLLAQYEKMLGLPHLGTTPLQGIKVSYSATPSPSYPDTTPSKLTNGTGGGFGEPLANDWVGFSANQQSTVTATVDLGSMKSVSSIEALFAGYGNSGISFPTNVIVEYSANNTTWSFMGNPAGQNTGFSTPALYAVGWVSVAATNAVPVSARWVAITATYTDWLFIGEIKIMAP
jgi:hypothetical protein